MVSDTMYYNLLDDTARPLSLLFVPLLDFTLLDFTFRIQPLWLEYALNIFSAFELLVYSIFVTGWWQHLPHLEFPF